MRANSERRQPHRVVVGKVMLGPGWTVTEPDNQIHSLDEEQVHTADHHQAPAATPKKKPKKVNNHISTMFLNNH